MTDDLERRLRETLHAYADLVEAPDDGTTPAPRQPAPVRPARRWRGTALAAAAAAAVVSGTVWLVDRPDSGPAASSDADRQASAPAAAPESGPEAMAGAASAGDQALSSMPVVGVGYPFDLSTHCGVRGADIGGVWFAADPPLVEGEGSPPGWADPVQPGTLTLVAADEAVFTDPAGHSVRLRADGSPRPPLCE